MSINTVVETSLRESGRGAYISYAAPVVSALTEREQEIAENLIQFAVSKGLSQEEAKAAVEQAGLTLPVEPEPEPVAVEASTLSSLQRSIESLTRFARQHGYRG